MARFAGGDILGNRCIHRKAQANARGEKTIEPEIRRIERFAARPSLEDLFSDIADEATRNERIHQAVRVHHYTLKEVGDLLGLHFSTISIIAKRVDEAKKNQE